MATLLFELDAFYNYLFTTDLFIVNLKMQDY